MKCPRFGELIAYGARELTAEAAGAMTAHLETECPRCAQTLEWYGKVLAITSADDTVDAPPWVLKRALRLFDWKAGRTSGRQDRRDLIGGGIQVLLASLVFDSRARSAVQGVRLTETANRQLLYRAGDYGVDLQVASVGQETADLLGQILRDGEPRFDSVRGLEVELNRGGGTASSTVTDGVGEFVLRVIGHGEYDLIIRTAEGPVIVRGLVLSGAA